MADSSELEMLEMQAHLQMRLQTVARRIVESARLAAAMHLCESPGDSGEWNGQRVAIGGAGPVPCASAPAADGIAIDPSVTEDALPAATAGVVKTQQSRRPSPRDAGGPFGGPGSPV